MNDDNQLISIQTVHDNTRRRREEEEEMSVIITTLIQQNCSLGLGGIHMFPCAFSRYVAVIVQTVNSMSTALHLFDERLHVWITSQ